MPNRHVSQLGILSMNKASIAIYAYHLDTGGVWHRILYFLGQRLGSLFKVILMLQVKLLSTSLLLRLTWTSNTKRLWVGARASHTCPGTSHLKKDEAFYRTPWKKINMCIIKWLNEYSAAKSDLQYLGKNERLRKCHSYIHLLLYTPVPFFFFQFFLHKVVTKVWCL